MDGHPEAWVARGACRCAKTYRAFCRAARRADIGAAEASIGVRRQAVRHARSARATRPRAPSHFTGGARIRRIRTPQLAPLGGVRRAPRSFAVPERRSRAAAGACCAQLGDPFARVNEGCSYTNTPTRRVRPNTLLVGWLTLHARAKEPSSERRRTLDSPVYVAAPNAGAVARPARTRRRRNMRVRTRGVRTRIRESTSAPKLTLVGWLALHVRAKEPSSERRWIPQCTSLPERRTRAAAAAVARPARTQRRRNMRV
jgi:hypothetical protein